MTLVQPSSRLDRLSDASGGLFVYGTLQFAAVLEALLGRVPAHILASAPGWRAAALEGRVYPGLVAAPGTAAAGLLLTDLTDQEWTLLDSFEDNRYDLREVSLSTGDHGLAYIWPDGEVRPEDWDRAEFESLHLQAYAARCARIGPKLAAGEPKGE
ncbi:gamma-glutamylcyclotransferase [Streptomyces sp. P3]|uniref:gamma-glutamylcyclotransferase family protein n=1 Tax=Streptomyces sp. P3 TaxID=2135430 RepID=UPI000D1C0871|nr:gamma-glutamylcyclotransferase family protein [Streptomyces sp. P3]AVV45400.1 gamma-glutamylcyclotransferase [Streptomyces sp. P3]